MRSNPSLKSASRSFWRLARDERAQSHHGGLLLGPFPFCDFGLDPRNELVPQNVLRAPDRTGDLMDYEEPGAMMHIAQHAQVVFVMVNPIGDLSGR